MERMLHVLIEHQPKETTMPKIHVQRDEKGVYRHAASGNVIPPEILREHGYPCTDEHMDAYDDEMAKVIDDYRKAQANMSDEAKAEQLFELRAVHGPGVKVVDVFTGREIIT